MQKDRGALHQTEEVGDSKSTWCLKFPGSDRTVMLRSERYRYELEKKRPSQIQAYVQVCIFRTMRLIIKGKPMTLDCVLEQSLSEYFFSVL